MNRRTAPEMLMTLLAAAALAGCGGGADAANEAAASDKAVNTEAAAAAPAADNAVAPTPAAVEIGGAPTAEFMVGKWSAMAEDCTDTLEFRKDGTLTTPIGEARWTLVGDKLTMDYGDGSKQPASTLKVLSQDRIDITTGGGSKDISKRC